MRFSLFCGLRLRGHFRQGRISGHDDRRLRRIYNITTNVDVVSFRHSRRIMRIQAHGTADMPGCLRWLTECSKIIGGLCSPQMRLESLLWVRIPILELFYAPEEIRFGYHIGYFLLNREESSVKIPILMILIESMPTHSPPRM